MIPLDFSLSPGARIFIAVLILYAIAVIGMALL